MASNRGSFQQTNSVMVVSVSMFTIYGHDHRKCRAPHTFVSMMAKNDALMKKHGVILYVGSLDQKTSRTSHLDEEIMCASWTQIGGRGQNTIYIMHTSSNRHIFPYH